MSVDTPSSRIHWAESIIVIGLLLFILATPILFNPDDTLEWNKIFRRWRNFSPYLGLFLINHYILLPRLLFSNKKLLYVGMVILLIGSIVFFEQRNRPSPKKSFPIAKRAERPHPPAGPPPGQGPKRRPGPGPREPGLFSYFPPSLNPILLSLFVLVFGTGFRSTFRWAQTAHDHTLLEKENVKHRLSMLKNQVSPHFFMNTLNNVHALIDIDPEQAKGAVIKLSKMMRHLLQEPESGKIALKDELLFLERYVDLMKIRYSEKVDIQLDFPANIPDLQIPPLLFTSLIENAFKHGVSYKLDSYIYIRLQIRDDKLGFDIKNSNHSQVNAENTGIGIQNTKDRLDLLYPGRYVLDIHENEESFQINLSLPV